MSMMNSKTYWEGYYKNNPNPSVESPFASFTLPFLEKGMSMYELGCGNGRDSVFFAQKGLNVTAFDQCDSEIEHLKGAFKNVNVSFEAGDFTALGKRKEVDSIYSRFTLHSVSEKLEKDTLDWAFKTLKPNGVLLIEIRSVLDELYGQGEALNTNEFMTSHYRRFVEFEPFVKRIQNAGFSIIYKIQAKGLAPYKSEDPVVIRVIAQKRSFD